MTFEARRDERPNLGCNFFQSMHFYVFFATLKNQACFQNTNAFY